jgi:hypothetical protein
LRKELCIKNFLSEKTTCKGGGLLMTSPYLCPNCKTNRSRFNIIEQVAKSVKLNPQSGEVVEEYTSGNMDPFHIPYKGPSHKIQCATCGQVDEEITFIKHAELQKG